MALKNKIGKEFAFDRKTKRTIKLDDSTTVTSDNYVRLLNYINGRVDEYSEYRTSLISRLEQIDCMLGGFESVAEARNFEERRREAAKGNDGDPLPTAKLNLTLDRLNDALTSIMGILFPHHSFYRATAEADYMQRAHALAKIMNEEARRFKHYSEISKIVMYALKYNLCGGIVEWKDIYGRTFANKGDVTAASLDTENSNVVFSGNSISAFDVYNSGWDMSVSIENVSREGEYFWQIKRESLFSLRKRLLVDKSIYGPDEFKDALKDLVSDISEIRERALTSRALDIDADFEYLSSFGTACRYHGRETFVYNGQNHNTVDPKMNWNAWAGGGTGGEKGHDQAIGTAEILEVFVKLNPRDFGLSKKDTMETWYFEIVNDVYIIYAVKIGESDAPFPLFLATLSDHTEVVDKTVAEMLMPLQDIGQKLISAHFQSVIKKLGNGNTFIRKGMVDAARIASNVNGIHEVDAVDHDKPLSYHIHQMSEVPETQNVVQELGTLENLARQALPTASGKVMTDLDRATKHQSETVKYENSRLMNHFAALLDDRGFSDMRIIMRDNELLNREQFDGGFAEKPENPDNPERLIYTVEEMREVQITVSNGLLNIDRFAVMSSLEMIINFIIQSGNRDRFDLTKIINFYSDYAGIETDLNQFILANPLDALDPEIQQFLTQAASNGQLEQIIAQLSGESQ